jgi:hypothetical protein
MFSADQTSKGWRLIAMVAVLLLSAGNVWRGFKNKRNRDEYLKLHASPTQRVKDHLRTELPAGD